MLTMPGENKTADIMA